MLGSKSVSSYATMAAVLHNSSSACKIKLILDSDGGLPLPRATLAIGEVADNEARATSKEPLPPQHAATMTLAHAWRRIRNKLNYEFRHYWLAFPERVLLVRLNEP
jgi:hypothetical protein